MDAARIRQNCAVRIILRFTVARSLGLFEALCFARLDIPAQCKEHDEKADGMK